MPRLPRRTACLPLSTCLSSNAVHSTVDRRINQLVEPVITPLTQSYDYPRLKMRPEANCKRYETLYARREVAV